MPTPDARGLTTAEAEALLAEFGPNEPTPAPRATLVLQVLRRFASPLVAILLVASVASAVLGDWINAGIILTMVVLSAALELFQTHRSQRAADLLRGSVAPTATVRRDGTYQPLARARVVPGDVVRLSAGDVVPADASLIECTHLHVTEAMLTGESLPVEKSLTGSDDERAVLMGSSVVSGGAVVRVVRTGERTRFGAIAKSLARRAPPTAFERGIASFGALILKLVVFLILFVLIVGAVLKHDPFQSLLFAVALAVGLTPEFLPMITTVTLAKGAVRMSRQKVIVKNLAAIQNFGSIDILCSDKTGTLTTGVMSLDAYVDPFGAASERPLLYGYVNASFESGVDNPLDAAILAHTPPPVDVAAFHKKDEVPFDFERRRVSVVAARGDETFIVTKGAPEHVLAVCTQIFVGEAAQPLDEAARSRCEATVLSLGAKGCRVIAVAYATATHPSAFDKDDEKDLILAGYLAFLDPPKEDTRALLAALAEEGVKVKILTGDSDVVTRHVCAAVGLETQGMLLGSEIDAMGDGALGQRAERTDVFARVSPAQKNRILRALQARGHVVGFLGDGINDAPSLHAADVGISVLGATDVAKDASDILLAESHLGVLKDGILEGRKAFANVMKYLLMGTSSNFGNMLSMAVATVFLPFLPMLATQLLLNNFLYDLAQITIPSDHVDDALVQKPRRWDIGVVRRFMLGIGPISSLYDFVTFFVLLRVFHADAALFHTGWFVESLSTQTLVIFVIRTAKSPFQSRPSAFLAATTLGVVLVGILLPFSPLAPALGFVPLPPSFFLFLVLATSTYLALVELTKRVLMKRILR